MSKKKVTQKTGDKGTNAYASGKSEINIGVPDKTEGKGLSIAWIGFFGLVIAAVITGLFAYMK